MRPLGDALETRGKSKQSLPAPFLPLFLHPLRTLPFCVQRGTRTGVKRESGHANTVCMSSPLLAAWPPPVRAPATCVGAPVPSPFRAQGSRPASVRKRGV